MGSCCETISNNRPRGKESTEVRKSQFVIYQIMSYYYALTAYLMSLVRLTTNYMVTVH